MLDLMSRIPEMSDIVITVFAARRRRLLESGRASLTLIGAEVDRTIRSIAGFAGRNRIPFRSLTLDEAEAEALANACSIAPNAPAVIFGKDTPIPEPTPRKIAARLGLDMDFDAETWHDVLIVGGGPAGIAAAVYAGPKACRRWCWKTSPSAGRPGPPAGSRTTWAFPPASRARTFAGGARCRR
jgi:thioredoxin reductase (NADPH)